MSVTFTLTGRLVDFGDDPRAGVKILAAPSPPVKVYDETVYGTEPESAITDSNGEFSIELVSLVGLWYRITAPRANGINPVRLAAYVVDPDDTTTGTVFAPGQTFDLASIMDENPTPGYEAVALVDPSAFITQSALDDEEAARIAADSALDVRVDALEAGGGGDVSQAELDAEEAARIAADTALDSRLDALEAAPGPDLSGYATDAELSAEASTRSSADSALNVRVSALESAPPVDLAPYATDADLSAEASARASADSALDARLDTLEADPGPDLSGYATDAELSSEAATRAGADSALDARVTGLEDVDMGDFVTTDELDDALDPIVADVASKAPQATTYTKTEVDTLVAGAAGTTDHGALSGLGDDDHTQYALADGSRGAFASTTHNHDSRYYTESEVDALIAGVSGGSGGVTAPEVAARVWMGV